MYRTSSSKNETDADLHHVTPETSLETSPQHTDRGAGHYLSLWRPSVGSRRVPGNYATPDQPATLLLTFFQRHNMAQRSPRILDPTSLDMNL